MPAVLQPNAAVVANLRRKPVGDEDIAAAKGHAAGILFVAPDGDVLLLRRSPKEANYAGHWALPGGGVEDGESPEDGARREAMEEMGPDVPQGRRKLIDQKVTPTGMVFHTFAQPVAEKFTPKLNAEHTGHGWAPLNALPSPMHPAVQSTLETRLGLAADMTRQDWEGIVGGLLKFLAEEAREPEHAEDADFSETDHPRAPDGKFGSGGTSSEIKPTKTLPAKEVEPPHRVQDNAKFEALVQSIKENGWQGRPVLAFEGHAGMMAATGSHRIAAAQEADVDIPVRQISSEAADYVDEDGNDITTFIATGDDESLAAFLEKAGDEDAAKLVWEEIEANAAADADFDALDDAIKACADADLALDRESIKSKDVDGRLHVADVPLCRESVDEYLGSEIPGYRKLGLEAGKKYALWRPAEELQKALTSINGIPVLRKHVATSASDHKSKDTIGSTGTGARWDTPFIRGELVIWPEQDIEGIESKERYNLSPGYRYEPILEEGNFEGKPYSLKMVNIAFNHIAVVDQGRQADVAIDSSEELQWAKIERAIQRL